MSVPVLEAIILTLTPDGIRHVCPLETPTMQLDWDEEFHPAEAIVDGVAAAGFAPFLVHATSWRMDRGRLVLTFIVGVEGAAPPMPDTTVMPSGFRSEAIGRAELVRGHALGPPVDIEPMHVVEHGLRHLAWLVGDDPGIQAALPAWLEALEAYEPEPFRAFG